jgi:hypothetical protein
VQKLENGYGYMGQFFIFCLCWLVEDSGLFFLGHMSWAYVFAVAFAGRRGGKLFVPAILILGVLPDVDLFLGGYGVGHRTFFHSIFFWVALFVPVLVIFRWKVVPYLVAVLQHFAFGDFFVEGVMLFWPFSSSFFGFNNAMLSVFDVFLETAGLLLAFGIMYYNGDLKRLLSVRLDNVWTVFPLLALVTSMLFFAVHWSLIPLITYIWSSPILTTIVIAHLILTAFLAISTVQGLRKLQGSSFEIK